MGTGIEWFCKPSEKGAFEHVMKAREIKLVHSYVLHDDYFPVDFVIHQISTEVVLIKQNLKFMSRW